MMDKNFSLLAIGKTQESSEAQEFKRYVGLGSAYVIAVNPTKKELETIYGREMANDPEYVVDTDNGKEARITFIVRTDPETNNGIEITERVMITLRNQPNYDSTNTKLQVIDQFGNTTYALAEDAKAGKKITTQDGKPIKFDDKYRIACQGEADLVGFLKPYLCVGDAFNYVNETWVKKENTDDYLFSLEHVKDYFSGDFSEIKEAIAMQPNNKVKLLFGVRNKEGKQYQTVVARSGFVLANSAGSRSMAHLDKELNRAKDRGSFADTILKVQPLEEFDVKPTDLSKASTAEEAPAASEEMPWNY